MELLHLNPLRQQVYGLLPLRSALGHESDLTLQMSVISAYY